ncbi:MAG: nucleotidyltransferase domain-containing protein, partial [Candidatus Hadarchaeales archaeon]
MKDVLAKVLRRIKPTPEDETRVKKVSHELLGRVEEAARNLGVSLKPLLVGSVARGTWRRGERDIDIFLLFPPELPVEELETLGLKVAREAAGGKGKERFAEHPYLHTRYNGFDVDLVP